MRFRASRTLLSFLLAAAVSPAQRPFSGTPEIEHALARLNHVASVLMIAAHPDDENTALLAWLARGRNVRTGYLSLTRGEGGQNLIGPEQGPLLGAIRTQELLQARKIDGAEQFFTSAVDFGYTKSAEETFAKWGREQVLGEIVYRIRRFRPDVIVLRFSGTPRDGHGQHQASAILGKEAFFAAADPARFPEQLKEVQPWKAKRIVWNAFNWTPELEKQAGEIAEKVEVDVGVFDPTLGYSYAEIAGLSRSMHRSQAFGVPQRKGPVPERLVPVAGEPARRDLFEGVALDWPGVAGGEKTGELLARALAEFRPDRPEGVVPTLLAARAAIRQMPEFPQREQKLHELDETVALVCGLWIDANAAVPTAVEGEKVAVTFTAINRSSEPVRLESVKLNGTTTEGAQLSGDLPWTARVEMLTSAKVPSAVFRVVVGNDAFEYERKLQHRYVDQMYGERVRPFVVVPAISVRVLNSPVIFPDRGVRQVDVELRAEKAIPGGELRLTDQLPVEPKSVPLGSMAKGARAVFHFQVTPPAQPASISISPTARSEGREYKLPVREIDYPHIETQVLVIPEKVELVRADIKTLARRIGYIMGSGDEVPRALEQIGCTVNLLTAADLATGDLGGYDAIVTGVRAFNVREDLIANAKRLHEYVERGGTLVVQYNVRRGESLPLGPYPITLSSDRVSVEEAPVSVLDAASPLLNAPNRITSHDWEGWIQERGLYFAGTWDPKYKTVIASNDPGEQPHAGGMLYAKYGKGAYVFTAYSWFRELPAGVPGAYRIFANLISAGKTLQ